MNVLRSLESKIAGVVEGAFGRAFRSEVRPVELARRLVKEMDDHRTISLSRTYVPNEYVVWLSPSDRERYEGVEDEVIEELSAYVLEHAREQRLALASRPLISFATDEQLRVGEFGIQARLVRAPEREPDVEPAYAPDDHGNTMIYSSSQRISEQLERARADRAGRAIVTLRGRTYPLPPSGAVIGRSRDCEVILDDTGVSRHHAQISLGTDGWTLRDLGSTNGVLLNGRPLARPAVLMGGEEIELGSTVLTFEVLR
ncbi:MAG TPA: DUF3662 and FHA domain-containing protein [Solirubrobacteraceae bacterium]|jgi:hypothetical protein|nr:DUF3662 and FHA domain-containing protein [Solirubrobacteraceae bacterium]